MSESVISPVFPLGILRAMLGRLIPRDEHPGALEAQTENYVIRQLKGDCATEAAGLIQGLQQLELESRARFAGADFKDLPEFNQDELLRAVEIGNVSVPWPPQLSPAAFFGRMVELAHEGFYADPASGGNLDALSWRMIGYDPWLPRGVAPKAQIPPEPAPPLSTPAGPAT